MGVFGGAAALKNFRPGVASTLFHFLPSLYPLPRRRPLHSAVFCLSSALDNNVVKLQWKAAIDFKWIRDNKDAVAANIRNRNSSANLDFVLGLTTIFSNFKRKLSICEGKEMKWQTR